MKNPKLESDLKETYSESFFNQHDRSFYPTLAESLRDACDTQINSVLDVGCGHGFLVESFRQLGMSAFGIEGSESAKSLWPEKFRDCYFIHDLTQFTNFQDIPETDLVCSFEVAEHIPNQFSDKFVEALTYRHPGTVILGAATVYQDLDKNPTHVNEQPFQYWINKISLAGYALDIVKTVALKELLFERKRSHGVKWWYPKNAMVFVPAELIQNCSEYHQKVASLDSTKLTWRIRSPNPVFNLMAERDRYEYLYLIESHIRKAREKAGNASTES